MNFSRRSDRLSELPESVILEILSLIPVEDVVSTTILSKRWKDLWTQVPFLNIEVKDPVEVVRARSFLHDFLLRWKGVCIRDLKISFSASTSNLELDSWVRCAMERKVENLWLDLGFDWRKPTETTRGLQRLPPCVYSCSSLKTLWISGCNLEIQEWVLVQWDNLRILYIDAESLGEDVINQVVSSSPRLESLELRLRSSSDRNLSIESSSLKRVSVTKYNVYARVHDPSLYGEITILAPNLESLHLWGSAYHRFDVLQITELKSLSLCFYDKWSGEVRQTLLQILPAIPHVEELTLSPCAFKMLGLMHARHSFPVTFPNVKKLKLDGGPITPKEMAALTQLFPQVETLLIHWKLDAWYPFFLKSLPATEEEEAKPCCCLNQLRTVEMIPYSNYDRSAFYYNYDPSAFHSMLRFLRDHAPKAAVRKGKGDGGLKVMVDELKGKFLFKRLRPGVWTKIILLSAAVAAFTSFV